MTVTVDSRFRGNDKKESRMTVTVLIKRVQDPLMPHNYHPQIQLFGDPESINEIPLTKMKM